MRLAVNQVLRVRGFKSLSSHHLREIRRPVDMAELADAPGSEPGVRTGRVGSTPTIYTISPQNEISSPPGSRGRMVEEGRGSKEQSAS